MQFNEAAAATYNDVQQIINITRYKLLRLGLLLLLPLLLLIIIIAEFGHF